MTLTAVIITTDQTKALPTAKSCAFADQVITIVEPQITNFAATRNRALKEVTTDWALFIDDDEFVTADLAQEIKNAIKSPRYNGYFLKRLDTFLGRTLRHGENGRNRFLRLARRQSGQFKRPVHEVWLVKGKVGVLRYPLLHNPHDDLRGFIAKINHYSTLEAQFRFEQGVHSSLFRLAIYPPAKFIKNYFFNLGFLDGVPGTIMALMMSLHSFLTWTKLYLLWQKK